MSREARVLRDENNELEKQLDDKTNDILTDIVVYIRSANISDIDQENVRRDITQMLIDARGRGENADDVIGGDYKAFCDAIIAEIPKLSAKQRIMTAIRDTLPALGLLIGIWVVFSVAEQIINGETWYVTPVSVTDILGGAAMLILATLIVVYITKNSFNAKPAALVCLILLITAVVLCAALLLPNRIIFSPNIAADAALIIVIFAAHKIIDNKL
jgi:hypothetical protein